MATDLQLFVVLLCVSRLAFARPSDSNNKQEEEEIPKWKKYFVNDTLTGRVVPCTTAEKFCLSRGLLLHEPDGKCYLFGDKGPCEWDEKLRVDKQEFVHGSGRVRAVCVNRYLCDTPGEFRMAYDGSCFDHRAIQDVCYIQPGIWTAENMFGETECSCANQGCPVEEKPIKVPSQDQLEEGLCAVPDLRATQLPRVSWRERVVTARPEVPCSETERRCFLDGRVYLAERDLCYDLWRQRPCPDGHWLLLDREEAVNGSGRLTGVCKKRPCGEGLVLSMVDGSCQTPEGLCGAYGVTFDVSGAAGCPSFGDEPVRLPTVRRPEGFCRYSGPQDEPPPPPQFYETLPPAPPACPDSRTGYCERHVHRKPTFTF